MAGLYLAAYAGCGLIYMLVKGLFKLLKEKERRVERLRQAKADFIESTALTTEA